MHLRKGFTLIELIVVVSIIGILVALSAGSYQRVSVNSRDTKRKSDLAEIKKSLDRYYLANDRYPPAGSCAYGSNCYVYSTAGATWLPALYPDYMDALPLDPRNSAGQPWLPGNYSYAYGNVSANGQTYDLFTQLENATDPDRCQARQYKFLWTNQNWCTAAQIAAGTRSALIYEISPGSF